MAANLELIISATDKASGVLSSVDKKAGGLGNTMSKVGGIATVGFAAGLGVAVVAGIDFVKQAAEEEASIKRLETAINANGGSWERQGAAIEEAIRQREKLAFSDDELRDSLSLLTAQTGDVDEALRRQGVAMDFARGAGIDLGTASKLLGKVTDENVQVLARYGIRAEEGMDATELLGRVQQKFGGQSAGFADTAAGRWQRFNNQIDNLKETIGAALLPILTNLADKLATFMEEHQEDIERIVKDWTEFAESEVFPMLEDAFDQLKQLIEGIMDTGILQWIADHKEAMILLGVVLGGLALAFGGPLIVIPVLIAAGVLLLAHWDQIRDKIEELWAKFNEKFPAIAAIAELAFEFIKNRVEFYINAVKDIVNIVMALLHGDWDKAWQGIKDFVSHLWETIKTEFRLLLDGFVLIIKELMPLVEDAMGLAWQGIKDLIDSIWDGIVGIIRGGINDIIGLINTLIRGLNSIPDINIKNPFGPDINIGIPSIPTIGTLGGGGPQSGTGMGANIGMSPINQRAAGGVTIQFNSVVPAGPAEIQRAKGAIESILRS